MEHRLKNYLDDLFAETPPTKRAAELKEEMYRNMSDKYSDLVSAGKTEEAAFNAVIASLGDPKELLDSLSVEATPTNAEQKRRSAARTSVAVMLYILSPIPLIALSTTAPIVGLVFLLLLAACATGLLVYDYMSKPTYHAKDETMVEEFRAWSSTNKRLKQTREAVSSALWTVTVAIYLLVSFNTGAWHISWVIFLIAAAVQSLITLLFNLKAKDK